VINHAHGLARGPHRRPPGRRPGQAPPPVPGRWRRTERAGATSEPRALV